MSLDKIITEYGLVSGAVAVLLLAAGMHKKEILQFMTTLSSKPVSYTPEQQLEYRLNYWLEQFRTEDTSGSDAEEARRKLLLTRYTVFKNRLESILRWDLKELSPVKFAGDLQTYVFESIKDAENACRQADIDEKFIIAYREHTRTTVDMLQAVIGIICQSDAFVDNQARLYHILNLISAAIPVVASASERVFEDVSHESG